MENLNPSENLAIFASGRGSNTQRIIDHFRNHASIKVALIVCNKPEARVLEIARLENIPYLIIEREKFFLDGYLNELRKYKIRWVILAGFLLKVPISLIKAFPSRIINIHPALLPSYGGKGMYGTAVHRAVIAAREPRSGITIHFVDEQYDHGKIILQKSIEVSHKDTPDTLASKVHDLEYQFFAPAIEKIITGSVTP